MLKERQDTDVLIPDVKNVFVQFLWGSVLP